jgi:3-dehydroquinate synthase
VFLSMTLSSKYGDMESEIPPHRIVTVDLGERSYPIAIGENLLPSLGVMVKDRVSSRDCVIITDKTVAALYLPQVRRALRSAGISVMPIIIQPGERQKNLKRANAIISTMLKKRIGRSSVVIALGGGVVGDLAGFVSAVYQRGVDFIQIPTTLLAQVDSSVGGKVGVNHPSGKNMIGAFHQPRFVLVDSRVLSTLPRREFICGLGEVVKYGIIADGIFFRYLEEHLNAIVSLDREAIEQIISRCCSLKAEVVRNDEREKILSGGRAILNFGHTVGHAIEAAAQYRGIKHGEAVLLGMLIESRMAGLLGLLPQVDEGRIAALINRLPLPGILAGLSNGSLLSFMAHDKKVSDKKVRFVLPTEIGSVQITGDVPKQVVIQSLTDIKKYFRHGKKP